MQIVDNQIFIEFSLIILSASIWIILYLLKSVKKTLSLLLQKLGFQKFTSKNSCSSRSVKRDV
jgi:hypothetical protein